MKYVIVLLTGLFLFIGLVHAVDEPVNATGDRIWGDDKKKITFIEGHVKIIQGSTMIITDKAKVNLDKKIAIFENKVKLTNQDITIEAEHLEFNFKKKQGTFSQKVTLQQKEIKDKDGKVTKDAFNLTTEELFFESDTKNFSVKKQGRIEHKDFTGTADGIDYHDQKQELTLQGQTLLKRPNGEEIKGNIITINTKSNLFEVDQRVNLDKDDLTITADHLSYDYKKKNGNFKDHVTLNRIETKDTRGKIAKDPFKLTADKLIFESETKNFETQGPGSVEHKDFSGFGNQINYNDQQQTLEFKDKAQLKRPKGEVIKGDSIIIYIKDKSFTVSNHVSIDFKVESDEEQK